MLRLNLRHLARNLRRSPATAGAAILTLSLTLGAGAAIFAVVDALLLTPPPFADPEALVTLGERPLDERTTAARAVSYTTFQAWQERARSLAALEAYDGTNLTLTGLGPAERLSATDVTPGFLTLLGVTPVLGRGFEADDIAQPVAIVSHSFWRSRLAADRNVLGRELVLGGQPHTIVGVLPERFVFALDVSDVWRPIPLSRAQAARTGYRVGIVARLARNVSVADLEIALEEATRRSSPATGVVATPVALAITGNARRPLALLAGAAAVALLVAFTNLAGLLIVRSIDRRRELAVRSALGAGRFAIAAQLLLEAQALVTIGAAGGVVVAMWVVPAVGRLALEQFGGVANRDIAVSWRLIGLVVGAASACAWMCALLPAILAARRSVADVLRRGATPPPRELVVRRLLVTGEVALAFVLLVSMTLLSRSLITVLEGDPGFDANGVMTAQVALPRSRYMSDERVAAFYSALQSAMDARLGVGTVGFVDEMPLTVNRGRALVRVRPDDLGRQAVVRAASPAYFDVMRIRVTAGRPFDARDDASAPLRAVISQTLADALFPFEPPIGRQLLMPAATGPAEIIGVVRDVKHRALDEPPLPTVYLSTLQAPSPSTIVVARSARPNADVLAALREEVARLDGDLPVYRPRPMADVVAASPGVPERRVLTVTVMGFAVLAVLLGGIGLFGVVAHDVSARSVELAVRVALGAEPTRIFTATLRQGAWIVGSGVVIGAFLSIWAARALRGLTLAANPFDLVSVSVASAVLLLAAAAAVLPTARRAARTDPLAALRSE